MTLYQPRWDGLRRDEALRVEIMQDVDRCMPDNTFFREQQTHSMMLDILFIFCKLNPDVSYRQGMHELLAPVLWVVQTDAVQDPSHSTDDFMVSSIFDSRFIEHDAFTLFSVLMQDAKIFYEQKAHQRRSDIGTLPTSGSLENPITTIINRMFTDYLPRLDPELAIHLRDLDLVPQVFLVRWIRLLFGREFPFDDVLPMWDLIFSEDPQLDSVEMICLVMILRLRWDLLEADHNDALSMLLRYPTLEKFQPQDLVRDALRLKSSFNAATAREIIEKYTDRPVTSTELPDPDDFALPELPTPTPRPRNIEQILSATARNVYVRSEKWGINKALRDAVDEVKRNVRDIQAMPTPTISSPRRHSRLSRSSVPRVDNMSELKLASVTQRTTQLAAQLKTATDSLWEIQRVLGEERGPDDGVVKDLGMAIARVGFVQVYLEDGSIPLATADEGDEKAAVDDKEDVSAKVSAKEEPAESKVAVAPAKADTTAPGAGQAATPQASRPPLLGARTGPCQRHALRRCGRRARRRRVFSELLDSQEARAQDCTTRRGNRLMDE